MNTGSAPIGGDAARELIEMMLGQHEGGIRSTLGGYRADSAVMTWLEVLRWVDEFLNVVWFGVARGSDREWLKACPLDERMILDQPLMERIRHIVERRHDGAVAARFTRMAIQLAETNRVFQERDLKPAGFPNGIDTIETGERYLQSRRRHLVSLLYAMPNACTGNTPLNPVLAFQSMACLAEHCCGSITGLHQKRLLMEVYPDFTMTETPAGFLGSHQFEELERNFLEAERVSIVGMNELRPDLVGTFRTETCPVGPVFSAAELRNNVRALGAAYSAYGEDETFSAMSLLIIALSRHCEDDYFIRIPRTRLESILANLAVPSVEKAMQWLIAEGGSYAEQTNRHHPFVEINGMLHGNVVLLSRFLNAFKNDHLASRRRFVIHSGFIFEEMVKSELEAMGFEVKPIKRVSRREFDVVAIRGDVIFNLQCKNNALDLSQIEAKPRLVASANKRLVAYYRRAIRKERARQGLLQAALGLTKIRHLVISRFPVITTDPAIIPFNALNRLASL